MSYDLLERSKDKSIHNQIISLSNPCVSQKRELYASSGRKESSIEGNIPMVKMHPQTCSACAKTNNLEKYNKSVVNHSEMSWSESIK